MLQLSQLIVEVLKIVTVAVLLLISGVIYSSCFDTDPGEFGELSTIALSLSLMVYSSVRILVINCVLDSINLWHVGLKYDSRQLTQTAF